MVRIAFLFRRRYFSPLFVLILLGSSLLFSGCSVNFCISNCQGTITSGAGGQGGNPGGTGGSSGGNGLANCPDQTTVANQIGADASLVTKIPGWPCGFKLADSNQPKQIHCPGAFDASLESASYSSGAIVIYWCPKGNSRRFTVYGSTIFDADVDPAGEPCVVLTKTPGGTVDGTNC